MRDVAERFFDLMFERYKDEIWFDDLREEEVVVLREVLAVAGFEFAGIISGGFILRNIQNPCFLVVDSEGNKIDIATGWLNQFSIFVVDLIRNGGKQFETKASIIGEICKKIEKSIPFAPIQITIDGDHLVEYLLVPVMEGFNHYFAEHSRDGDEVTGGRAIGVHQYCDGYIDIKPATADKNALICRSCFLRVLIPIGLKTYGEIRRDLTKRIFEGKR